MTNTRHTSSGRNLAQTLREAMGPGYQVPAVVRAFERQLLQAVDSSCCPG